MHPLHAPATTHSGSDPLQPPIDVGGVPWLAGQEPLDRLLLVVHRVMVEGLQAEGRLAEPVEDPQEVLAKRDGPCHQLVILLAASTITLRGSSTALSPGSTSFRSASASVSVSRSPCTTTWSPWSVSYTVGHPPPWLPEYTSCSFMPPSSPPLRGGYAYCRSSSSAYAQGVKPAQQHAA